MTATELLGDLSQEDIVAVALHIAGELRRPDGTLGETITWIRMRRKLSGKLACQLQVTRNQVNSDDAQSGQT